MPLSHPSAVARSRPALRSRLVPPIAAGVLLALTAGFASAQPGRPGGGGFKGGPGVVRIPGNVGRINPGPIPGPVGRPVVTIPGGLRHHHPHYRPVITIPVPVAVPVGGPTVVVESPPVVVAPPAPPVVDGTTTEVPVTAAGQPSGGNTTAIKITEVLARGPAARAGLQPGDIVLKIDDRRVKTCDELRAAVTRASKVVVLFYNPDDQKLDTREVPVADGKIGIMMEEIPVNLEEEPPPAGTGTGPVVAAAAAGPTAPQIAEVVPRGPAARAGLQVGDVIVAVDGKRVSTPAALSAALKSAAEVEVLFVNPDTGKSEFRKLRPANGDVGLTTKAVPVAEK
jgi:hypothetical protein